VQAAPFERPTSLSALFCVCTHLTSIDCVACALSLLAELLSSAAVGALALPVGAGVGVEVGVLLLLCRIRHFEYVMEMSVDGA